MLDNAILLITSILGFLSTALILTKSSRKESTLINKYLIFITANTSIRFLFHWISESYPELNIKEIITIIDVSFIMVIPCYYLYFQNIIYEKKFELSNLFHLVVPVVLGGVFISNRYAPSSRVELYFKLFFALAILFYIFYAVAGFVMLYKHVWHRKSEIKVIQKQNEQIKNWSLFLYFSFVLIFIIRLVNGLISNKIGNLGNNNLWMPALVWIAIFVKIIWSPEVLFGYDILRTACLQFSEAKRIAKDDLKEGDLVFFRVGTSRISHVGVYLRNNFFVHSASSKGVSIANLGNAYWSKYFAGGGRIMQ
jgi:hypothetical protein